MPLRCSDTKPFCHVTRASVALPGVSIAHISGNKPLLLCQAGSLSTPRACSARPRRGSPVYLGTVTPVSTVVLPSGRWAAHAARDAPLRERCGRRVPPCGETTQQGAGEEGGGHGTTGGGEPPRTIRRWLAAWPRDRGPPR